MGEATHVFFVASMQRCTGSGRSSAAHGRSLRRTASVPTRARITPPTAIRPERPAAGVGHNERREDEWIIPPRGCVVASLITVLPLLCESGPPSRILQRSLGENSLMLRAVQG